MNADFKRWVQAGAWLSLIFACLAAAAIVADHFTAAPFEAGMKESVTAVLESKEGEKRLPSDAVFLGTATDGSTLAWKAAIGKKASGYVFVARVTGNAGPWPAVFAYDPVEGAYFAGIAGREDGFLSPERYGLTPRILEFWTRKCEALAEGLEEQK